MLNYTRNEWGRCWTTLETSVEDVELHSKRVGRMLKYTRNEWGRCWTTLEMSKNQGDFEEENTEKMQRGHSDEVENTLGTSGEESKTHSERVGKMLNYTPTEWKSKWTKCLKKLETYINRFPIKTRRCKNCKGVEKYLNIFNLFRTFCGQRKKNVSGLTRRGSR